MKQLTFPHRTTCTLIYPDGHEERVIYGQYEAIQIIAENGRPYPRTITLSGQTLCTNVTRADGILVMFDEPFYNIET